MDAYLFPALFCLVLCTAFVWLAVKRMRADKPHRVFLWLARFFGVMVVMGVNDAFRREGIILGGLVVVAGAFAVLATVSWVVRELGKRKKAEQDSTQSEITKAPKEEEAPVQEQEDEARKGGAALPLPIQNHSTLKRRGTFNVVGWIALGVCMTLVAPLWVLFQQQKEMKDALRHIKGEIESISFTKEEILSIVRQENQKQKSHIDDSIKQVNEKLQKDINDLQDSLAGVKSSQDEMETFFKEKMEIAMDEINVIKSDSAVKQMKDNGIPLLDKPDFSSPQIQALVKKSKQWNTKNKKTAEKRFLEISAFLLRHHTEDKTIADTFSQNIVLQKELDASNGMPDSFMKMRVAYYFMKEMYGPDAAKEPGVYFLSLNKPKPKLKSDTYYSAFVAVYDDLASDIEKIYLKSQEEQKGKKYIIPKVCSFRLPKPLVSIGELYNVILNSSTKERKDMGLSWNEDQLATCRKFMQTYDVWHQSFSPIENIIGRESKDGNAYFNIGVRVLQGSETFSQETICGASNDDLQEFNDIILAELKQQISKASQVFDGKNEILSFSGATVEQIKGLHALHYSYTRTTSRSLSPVVIHVYIVGGNKKQCVITISRNTSKENKWKGFSEKVIRDFDFSPITQ